MSHIMSFISFCVFVIFPCLRRLKNTILTISRRCLIANNAINNTKIIFNSYMVLSPCLTKYTIKAE